MVFFCIDLIYIRSSWIIFTTSQLEQLLHTVGYLLIVYLLYLLVLYIEVMTH